MLLWQVLYVYKYTYGVGFEDTRVRIMVLALISSAYSFFHYGIQPRSYRLKDFVIIIFFQTTIFYSMCLYFAQKASGLLKKRK